MICGRRRPLLLFRLLVAEPFRHDLETWAGRGFCAPSPDRREVLLLLARYAGLRATLLHRVGHWGVHARMPGVPMFLQALNLALHGIEMAPSVPIGRGLYLPHTAGSVIHAERIGSDVEIQGGITIGQRTADGFPTIGDGVLLGAGCRVLGHITLGDGAQVGANAVVLSDVPGSTTVVGVPARAVGADAVVLPAAEVL